jgi:ATP-dependent Lon protease
VLIPQENQKDLADIPDNVKSSLTIIPVTVVDEVLMHALVSQPVPLSDEPETTSQVSHDDDSGETADSITAH